MEKRPKFFGSHISISHGFDKVAEVIGKSNINVIQIHPSPPQRWIFKEINSSIELGLRRLIEEKGVKVFFHGIYLINLASPDETIAKRSVKSLEVYLNLLKKIGGSGVVFHPGSITDKADLETGLERVVSRLAPIVDQFSSLQHAILLEVSAGRSHVIGSSLKHFRYILDSLRNHTALAVALDTQHLWASGYNLKQGLGNLILELKELSLLDLVKLIHVNDSKSDCGSYVDRHENIGLGKLGKEFFVELFRRKEFINVPMVLETPNVKDYSTLIDEALTCFKLMDRN
ncbi:MAG: deoxyribonuclease IV [Deltaproteobacteria bacterium]|nr:deoxyribonuclease IV [Deltaproteobacteria bacterium]